MNFVVDTNVPVVANGRGQGDAQPSIGSRLASIAFLELLLKDGRIHLDINGEIQAEYHRYLNPRGQPGVGDRFYQAVINSAPERISRVSLDRLQSGEYADFPDDPSLANFDLGDRKFVALALKQGVPVANAVDSDWVNHRKELEACGLTIEFICGVDPATWWAQ